MVFRVVLIATLALCLILSACGVFSQSNSTYEIGPGRISGKLVVNAPSVSFFLKSPSQSQPDGVALLSLPGSFALFHGNSIYATRSLTFPAPNQEDTDVPGVPVDIPGRCALPFSFEQIPVDTYRLGFYWLAGGDWDIPTVLHFHKELAIPLSRKAPFADDVTYSWDQYGDCEQGGIVRGKLLLSGNAAVNGLYFKLYPAVEDTSDWQREINHPAWSLKMQPALYGRVYFKMQGIKAGSYKTDWNTIPGQWEDYLWQDGNLDSPQAPQFLFDIANDQEITSVTACDYYWTFPQWSEGQPEDYVLRHRGIMQVELHLTSDIGWSKDTLLLAESVPASSNPNYSAWNYIVTQHFNTDGVGIFRLSCLHDGDYRVSLLQLGETNDDPPVLLASMEQLVKLVYPHTDPIPDEIFQHDAPYAEVVWTPEIAK